MDILNGLLYINDTDVYKQYGAFLCEDRSGDNSNYAALLQPAAMKAHKGVDFREQNGEKYPDTLTPALSAREVTLQFAIQAADTTAFLRQYAAFLAFVKSGWLNLRLPELERTFRMFYLSAMEYKQLTPLGNGDVAAKFKLKFREPQPFI